ncbi:hypothetical protein [Micromonospora sp. B006]|uniref:hypothetical protein n=1 Tax=Micromonospora sp. B006 TaxID=2201999 RepID=UPI001CEF862B|nr:hypothetical protein [Micromonospora sp. B006]
MPEDEPVGSEQFEADGEVGGSPPSRSKGGQGNIFRSYPRRSLEQALRIPNAIKDHNAGNPWDPAEIAAALNLGPKSGNYYYLTNASRDFGLTEGNRDSPAIKLTSLGRRVVYPENQDEERQALLDAFFSVATFRQLVEYYKGSKLPEERFLSNVLQNTLKIDPRIHAEFIDLFEKNCRYVGVGEEFDVASSKSSPKAAATPPALITLASPAGGPTPELTCFIAMPFTERHEDHPPGYFTEVLENLFTPALQDAGFKVKTAIQYGSDLIHHTLLNELINADLVLADLSEHNPNVLFELGIRMAVNKPVVLVRSRGTGPIFDVDNALRVWDYNSTLWKSAVEKDVPRLTEHVIGAWQNKDTNPSYMDILRRTSPL